MNNKYKNRASYMFEKLYNPDKQHFNIDDIRDRNIKKINEIIYDLEHVDESYSALKRQTIIDVENDSSLSDKEKNKAIDKKFQEIDDCIYEDKKLLERKLKDEIRHQIKRLLYLDDYKKMYEYYISIYKKPLDSKYASLESDLYREFLLRNPSVESIIASYSALEEEKASQEQVEENDEKKETTKTDDKEKKTDDKEEPIDTEDDLIDAQKAIETATITGSKSDIQKAYDAVGLIKNETKKEELTNKLDELVKKITMDFISTLNRLKEVYERNKNAKVKREEITKLVSDFDNLYKDEIPEIGFSKKSAIKDVDWVILSYNATKQKEYQENQEVETNEKGKIKKIFSIFKSFLELKPIVSTTKLMAKFFKKKLAKNVEKGNDEKVKKYENIIREMDIVNSVTMFRKKNEIAKMKPKLYKNGTDGLDAKEKDKYYVSQNVISSILLKQLLNKTGEDVYKDKLRVKTVISQWLDLYTRIGTDEVVVSDLLKRENVIYTKEEIKEEIDEFLNNARRAKSITRAEYISYLDELRNIDFYKANYDDYYEIPSVKYEDGSYYEELEDKKKYYKQPVIYKDLDKEISISYIKK